MNLQSILSNLESRKQNVVKVVFLTALLALCVVGMVSGTAQSPQDNAAASSVEEREFKNTVPAHVPIKIKLKTEQSFKKKENKNWARELEIEVKNTGSKPIYFIYMRISS